MKITLPISNSDIEPYKDIIESMSPEELSRNFIRFLTVEKKVTDQRITEYLTRENSGKPRSPAEQASDEEVIKKLKKSDPMKLWNILDGDETIEELLAALD
jgi:hypothetical protein